MDFDSSLLEMVAKIWLGGDWVDARPLPQGEGGPLVRSGITWALLARSPSHSCSRHYARIKMRCKHCKNAANVSPSPRGRGLG